MTWIDKILPILTLILGFSLSEFGKYFTDRKNDRKKFKNLLFNLLELRWLLRQEITLNSKISQYVERTKVILIKEFGPESVEGEEHFKSIIVKILKDSIVQQGKIAEIENNIDATIIELSEIYPIFAYELSGRYKIKENIENAEQYFQTIANQLEEFPTEIKDWIKPKISNELIADLDEYIKLIAKRIGRKTSKDAIEKLKPEDGNDISELNKFIDEYITEIKKIIPNN